MPGAGGVTFFRFSGETVVGAGDASDAGFSVPVETTYDVRYYLTEPGTFLSGTVWIPDFPIGIPAPSLTFALLLDGSAIATTAAIVTAGAGAYPFNFASPVPFVPGQHLRLSVTGAANSGGVAFAASIAASAGA